MAGRKYAPLNRLLTAAASRGESAVQMDFTQLADLVGGLPTSAYTRRGWWANGYLVQANSWRHAGWRVRKVDLPQQWVLFVREDVPSGVVSPSGTRVADVIDGGINTA